MESRCLGEKETTIDSIIFQRASWKRRCDGKERDSFIIEVL